MRLWDVDTASFVGPALKVSGHAQAAKFSADGRTILAFSRDPNPQKVMTNTLVGNVQRMNLWDTRTGARIGKPLNIQGSILEAGFSPDGKEALILEVYSRIPERPIRRQRGPSIPVGPQDGDSTLTVRVWDAYSGALIGKPMVCSIEDRVVAISPDCRRVLTGSSRTPVRLWDTVTGQPVGAQLEGRPGLFLAGFSPDSKMLVITGSGAAEGLWDTSTGKRIGQPHSKRRWAPPFAFSPDSKTLAIACQGGSAELWETTTGHSIGAPLAVRGGQQRRIAFSPDGKTVLTVGEDEGRLWDAATGHPIGERIDYSYSSSLRSFAFSPDGKSVIIAAKDGTLALWDASTGHPVGHLAGILRNNPQTTNVAFSPDGRNILVDRGFALEQSWLLGCDPAAARKGHPAPRQPHGVPLQLGWEDRAHWRSGLEDGSTLGHGRR